MRRIPHIAADPFSRSIPRWEKLQPAGANYYSVQIQNQYPILDKVSNSNHEIEIYCVGPHPSGTTYRNREGRMDHITDRAKRYRAQKAIRQPEPRCMYCG